MFLGASALVWFGYGAFCFVQPGYLGEAAGVAAIGATGVVELRAMYGGLQMAIGALAAAGLARTTLERPALVAIGFLCAGLGPARLCAAIAAANLSAYTGWALAFELGSVAFAARSLALARSPAIDAPVV